MIAAYALAALVSGITFAPAPGTFDDGRGRVPAFRLRDLDGEERGWAPGKPLVLTFVAFWCDTWKEHLPRFEQARRSLAGLDLSFCAVTADGSRAEVAKELGRKVLLDRDGHLAKALGLDRIPSTMLIDKHGAVLWRRDGIVRPEELVEAIRSGLSAGDAQKTAYLTFDDFPGKRLNDELLDVLRAEGVPATFFVIGKNADANRPMLERATREGHALQVHGWTHGNGPETPPGPKTRFEDPSRCAKLIREATGQEPTLFRPPGTEKLYEIPAGITPLAPSGKAPGRAQGLQALVPQPPVVDPYDYSLPGAAELVRRVSLAIKPGCVIQLHAGVTDTLAALPEILRLLREQGYKLKVLR